jgi:hypothetical protein
MFSTSNKRIMVSTAGWWLMERPPHIPHLSFLPGIKAAPKPISRSTPNAKSPDQTQIDIQQDVPPVADEHFNAKLRALQSAREQGLLSEEEFSEAKASALDSFTKSLPTVVVSKSKVMV